MKRIYLIIITCFAVLATASAQKLTVESMTVAGNDISASQYERKDLNGKPCALVKVQLAAMGAVFEGNVIGKADNKTGEYWVYMTAGSKELRIKHPNFVPLAVQFSNYGIKGLESKATYVLTLLMPQGAAIPVQTQKLTINYSPSNAMVLVDSKPYQGMGHIEVMLPVGTHEYIIAAAGYDTAEGSVKLLATSPRTITENLNKAAGEVSQALLSDASDKELARQRKAEEKERAKAEKAQAKAQKEREKSLVNANPLWNLKIGGSGYSQSLVDLLRAASQEDAEAEYRLGQSFYLGQEEYLGRNNRAAQYWYTKARDHGHQMAGEALKQIGEIPADKMIVWGLVTDKKERVALIGCSICLNGKAVSITDLDGMFTLLVPKDGIDTLEFSYVGYKTVKDTLDKSKNPPLHIEMK